MIRKINLLFMVVALSLVVVSPAHAYVDPGVGAMLWQALLAALFGALFFARNAMLWLRSRLPRLFRSSSPPRDP